MGKLTLNDLLDPKYRVKKLYLLIDGDVYAHKAANVTDGRMYTVGKSIFKYKKDADKFAKENGDLEVTVEYQPEPLKNCIKVLKTSIESIEHTLSHKSDHIVSKVYVTGSLNFRSDILEHYKWNRLGVDEVIKRCDGDEEKAREILRMKPETFEKNKGVTPRMPAHLKKSKEYLLERMGAIREDYYEADDLIGLEANRLALAGEDYIVVSIDKDLNCIPGWHYNSDRDEIYHVSEAEALRNFYYQCLLGDTTDNIPGIPGVGPKTAEKILKGVEVTTPHGYYSAVLAKWSDVYGEDAEEKLLKSAQCLWILQNSQGKSVEDQVWNPPTEMSKIDKAVHG